MAQALQASATRQSAEQLHLPQFRRLQQAHDAQQRRQLILRPLRAQTTTKSARPIQQANPAPLSAWDSIQHRAKPNSIPEESAPQQERKLRKKDLQAQLNPVDEVPFRPRRAKFDPRARRSRRIPQAPT